MCLDSNYNEQAPRYYLNQRWRSAPNHCLAPISMSHSVYQEPYNHQAISYHRILTPLYTYISYDRVVLTELQRPKYIISHTQAHSSVVLCFAADSIHIFFHILQECFTGTEAIPLVPSKGIITKSQQNITLQWRHNERDGVSNHQPHDCLHNRLFRRRSKKTSKLRVTGLCEGNSPVTGEFPAQMASNAENVSIWWRHHEQMQRAQAAILTSWWRQNDVATSFLRHNDVILASCARCAFLEM